MFDRSRFSNKLNQICSQLQVTIEELSDSTGIPSSRLNELIKKKVDPTGDEILILADFFKTDYNYFISNERMTAFEQTDKLFRKFGDDLTKEDRWAIQEFLFLCETESFILEVLEKPRATPFSFIPRGNIYKQHGQEAAKALRKHLEYSDLADPSTLNIYEDFIRLGIHCFRRKISGSISGMCIGHPIAGPCILINYNEDPFRQRFSVAHEMAHAVFDLNEEGFVISFWGNRDLREIRANSFASNFLIPHGLLKEIQVRKWNEESIVEWANKLMVNVEPLAIALKDNNMINEDQFQKYRRLKIKSIDKNDPEIPKTMAPKSRVRIAELLKRGLSHFYVKACFECYYQGHVSMGRLAEMLLTNETDLSNIAVLYGVKLKHDY